MKTKFIKLFLIIVTPIIMVVTLIKSTNAHQDGQPTTPGDPGNAYAPGELTCRECHSTYALNTTQGAQVYIPNINTLFPNGQYVGGQQYNMSISISAGSLTTGGRVYGFAIEALKTGSPYSNAGTLTVTDVVNSQTMSISGIQAQTRNTIIHTLALGTAVNSTGVSTINFKWTAPSSGFGQVTFHITGLVGNNNGGRTGDYVAVKKYKITG